MDLLVNLYCSLAARIITEISHYLTDVSFSNLFSYGSSYGVRCSFGLTEKWRMARVQGLGIHVYSRSLDHALLYLEWNGLILGTEKVGTRYVLVSRILKR